MNRIIDMMNTIQIQPGVEVSPVIVCPMVSNKMKVITNPIMLRISSQNQILLNGFIAIFGRPLFFIYVYSAMRSHICVELTHMLEVVRSR